MTKLEEKLIELGYDFIDSCYNQHCYRKSIKGCRVVINVFKGKVIGRYIDKAIIYQQDIDNLQQAYNILQSDLEVLKKC